MDCKKVTNRSRGSPGLMTETNRSIIATQSNDDRMRKTSAVPTIFDRSSGFLTRSLTTTAFIPSEETAVKIETKECP